MKGCGSIYRGEIVEDKDELISTCRTFGTRVLNARVLFLMFIVQSSNVRVLFSYIPTAWNVPFDIEYTTSSNIRGGKNDRSECENRPFEGGRMIICA
jgi:hypothetical protein